jgi:hypothetical protein
MNALHVPEHWYKAVLAAGVVLAAAAVAVAHKPLLILGIGMVFWGIGEFINHPYREKVGYGFKVTGHPWEPKLLGILLDMIGAVLIVFGLFQIVWA